jgi:3'(2'), 5'-bisphosphate nucleotidase
VSAPAIDVGQALDRVLSIAEEAGRRIMEIYGRGAVAVDYKGVDDPVTIADHEANAIICRALLAAYPGVPIVAEESDPSTFSGWTRERAVWFVDPLDGTREFIARNGEFAVMIGLAVDGRPALGVVTLPALERRFVGAPGIGAFEVFAAGRRPVRVSTTAAMADAELVVSRSHQPVPLDELAKHVRVRKLTAVGSAGVKAMFVAAGEADVYCQPGTAGK